VRVEKQLFRAHCGEVLALVQHGDELRYEGGDEFHAELCEIFPDRKGTVSITGISERVIILWMRSS
jgi:hypothetical protein